MYTMSKRNERESAQSATIICDNAGHPNVLILSTMGEIEQLRKMLEKNSRDFNEELLKKLTNAIKVDTTAIYDNKKDWDKFSENILAYYLLRNILQDECIPFIPETTIRRLITEPHRHLDNVSQCSHCGKKASNTCMTCGAPYCSRMCQRLDWVVHKPRCSDVNTNATYDSD